MDNISLLFCNYGNKVCVKFDNVYYPINNKYYME